MARIAGVDLPRTKRVEIGLTYIYGIGRTRSNDILSASGVSGDIRVKDLSEDDVEDQPGDRGAGPRRGRPAQRELDEHQAAGRDRQLSRVAPSAQSARARTAH